MATSLFSLNDHQTFILVVTLLLGAFGGFTGAFWHIIQQYDAPAKGRRLTRALLYGLFAGAIVFTQLGSAVFEPSQALISAAAFFAIVLGFWGGGVASRRVDKNLEKQALLRKMVDAQLS